MRDRFVGNVSTNNEMNSSRCFVASTILWSGSNQVNDFRNAGCKDSQTNQDEEDDEGTTENSLAVDVTITNGGHGYNQEVDTFPIGNVLVIFKVYRVT